MSQYYWTAEDYSVGDVPSEWVAEANITSHEIAEDGSGNKYLDIVAPDSTRSFLTFDTPEDTQDGEIWARIQTSSDADVWGYLRGTSLTTPSSADLTRGDYFPADGTEGLSEFDGGSYSLLTSQANAVSAGNICQLRSSFSSDTLEGRWWADGSSEPGTWGLTATTAVTGSGASGVGHYSGTEFRVYEFGVGTSSDAAPTEPVLSSVTDSGSVTEGVVVTEESTDSSSVTDDGFLTLTSASPVTATVTVEIEADVASGETLTVSDGESSTYSSPFSNAGTVNNAGSFGIATSFAVEGTVTLQGSSVSDATVIGINDTRGEVQAITTTDTNGEYSLTFPAGDVAHIMVEYNDGTEQFNTQSEPFIVVE